jgi:hypothetical protein
MSLLYQLYTTPTPAILDTTTEIHPNTHNGHKAPGPCTVYRQWRVSVAWIYEVRLGC